MLVKELSILYQNAAKAIDMSLIQGTNHFSAEDQIYSNHQEEILTRTTKPLSFLKPNNLEKWINDCLVSYNKGVLLLQMERGMGKTTFVRGLDEQGFRKMSLANTCVRAYYINGTYSYKVNHFVSEINDILRQDKNKKIVFKGDTESTKLSANTMNKKQDFSNILGFYQQQHSKHFGTKKLLFILDGLDEIPLGERERIVDFIPANHMLNEGIYILLTCRTDKELLGDSKSLLKDMAFTEKKSIYLEDQDNIELLYTHTENLLKSKHIPFTDKDIEMVLRKAQYRFLYLNTILQTINSRHTIEFGSLPEGDNLIKYFLEYLRGLYSDKFFEEVTNILGVLAIANEPLTVKELSYLLGAEKITFSFLASLTDLRGLLHFERSHRGDVVTLNHEDIRKYIQEKYNASIISILERWIVTIENLKRQREFSGLVHDGELYLYAYIMKNIEKFLPTEEDRLLRFDVAETMFYDIWELNIKELKSYQIKRLLEAFINILRILEDVKNPNGNSYKIKAISYIKISELKNMIGDYEGAIADASRGIDIFEENNLIYKNSADSKTLSILFDGYITRASSYLTCQKYIEAIKDYYLVERLYEKPFLTTDKRKKDLMMVFNGLGKCYLNMGRNQKAIEYFDKSINGYIDSLSDYEVNHLLSVLFNRAKAYKNMGKYIEARESIDRYIDEIKKLEEREGFIGRFQLASIFQSKGQFSYFLKDYEEAIGHFNQAVDITSKALEEGDIVDYIKVLELYNERGKTYLELKDLEKGLKDINEIEKILDHIKKVGGYVPEGVRLEIMITKADYLLGVQDLRGAIKEYTSILQMLDELLKPEKKDYYVEMKIKLLFKRGKVFQIRKLWNKSYKDLQTAVEWVEESIKKQKKVDYIFLADLISARGDFYKNNKNYRKALEDYTCCIALVEESYDYEDSTASSLFRETLFKRSKLYLEFNQKDKSDRDKARIEKLNQ